MFVFTGFGGADRTIWLFSTSIRPRPRLTQSPDIAAISGLCNASDALGGLFGDHGSKKTFATVHAKLEATCQFDKLETGSAAKMSLPAAVWRPSPETCTAADRSETTASWQRSAIVIIQCPTGTALSPLMIIIASSSFGSGDAKARVRTDPSPNSTFAPAG